MAGESSPRPAEEPDADVTGARIEVTREEPVVSERQLMKLQPGWRARRALLVTAIFLGLWLLTISLIHVEGVAVASLILLVPVYAIVLALATRPPRAKRVKSRRARLGWQAKLIGSILVFLLIYLPFTFFSNRIIPYAPLVEYLLFAFAIFLLYRLVARSVGVAGSVEALPPPTHRTHRQVVGAIDDPHYQRTVVLNFNFVERGKSPKPLIGRLERVLTLNEVPPERRQEILGPLEEASGGFLGAFGRRGGQRGRQERAQALRTTLDRFNRELEVFA